MKLHKVLEITKPDKSLPGPFCHSTFPHPGHDQCPGVPFDTPPQPAHGEPWAKVTVTEARVISTEPVTYSIDGIESDFMFIVHEEDALRIADTWNLLAPHPDLSAVEVHSKETMDEVREALDLFGKIFTLQKPAPLGGWNWDQLASQSTAALAKLNPPQ